MLQLQHETRIWIDVAFQYFFSMTFGHLFQIWSFVKKSTTDYLDGRDDAETKFTISPTFQAQGLTLWLG